MSYAATAGYAPSGSKAEPWRNGLWVVLSAGLLYGLLHATFRLALSSNLPQDDVTANILAQTLEPGYLPRQHRSTNGCCGRYSAWPGRRCRASSSSNMGC